ncbi:CLUMA_CG010208, isoform A [Clunio marinus]|uniref:CLUMA_CG010208, isoform A n=1 Tax=Clunio marinus TaxID=568069 RepID=A0A1J1I8P4_9DIPT|nr:CLUMA_CG010208, isoform A [Clunio marinus]
MPPNIVNQVLGIFKFWVTKCWALWGCCGKCFDVKLKAINQTSARIPHIDGQRSKPLKQNIGEFEIHELVGVEVKAFLHYSQPLPVRKSLSFENVHTFFLDFHTCQSPHPSSTRNSEKC